MTYTYNSISNNWVVYPLRGAELLGGFLVREKLIFLFFVAFYGQIEILRICFKS